jgi:hypothetical protein
VVAVEGNDDLSEDAMKVRSKFTVEGQAATEDGVGRFRAETEARVTLETEGGKRVLRISGKSLWARLRLTDGEARRIISELEKSLEVRDDDSEEQIVFFPRRAKAGSS